MEHVRTVSWKESFMRSVLSGVAESPIVMEARSFSYSSTQLCVAS